MISLTIREGEAGRKLGRYLEKRLPHAPHAFFFKALRQGKFKVDRRKPKDLNLVLEAGNTVDIYLTDEQLKEFGYSSAGSEKPVSSSPLRSAESQLRALTVIYEDDAILAVEKPVGILSQKSRPEDVSMTEAARAYLQKNGFTFEPTFQPSFVHRLDRNTGGLMIMAKTLPASAALSSMIRRHDLKKYYWAVVQGNTSLWKVPEHLKDTYRKDRKENKAEVRPWNDELLKEGWESCELIVRHLNILPGERSLVEIQLLTGRSHQIRAQLAFHGFPICGDGKYTGNEKSFRQQLLARKVVFTHCPEAIGYMEGRELEVPVPPYMQIPEEMIRSDL